MNALRNIFTIWKAKIQALVLPTTATQRMPEGQPSSRDEIIARLVTLQARDRAEVAERDTQITELNASLRQLESRMNVLHDQLRTAWAQKMVHSIQVGVELDKLRMQLVETAPAGLGQLLEQIDMEIERVRHSPTMEQRLIDRLAKLRMVRQQAMELQVAPLEMAQLRTRLSELQHMHGLAAVTN